MSKRRISIKKENGSFEPGITYGNYIAVLVVFCILIFSFSSIDSSKFTNVAASLSKALKGNANSAADIETNGTTNLDSSIDFINESGSSSTNGQTQKIFNQVTEFVKSTHLNADVKTSMDIQGVKIELQGSVFFNSGSAVISQKGLSELDKVSELLSTLPNKIMVIDYIDNVPADSQYYNNSLKLSGDRAVNIVNYLTKKRNLNPADFYAVGGGEYQPAANNDTPDGRQRNDRIDILIVS